MWKLDDYSLQVAGEPGSTLAEKVFGLVWRFDFTAPGFCLLDAGTCVDSHTLRFWMVALKERLGEVGMRRHSGPFAFRALARFDQQETTKFHVDGGPERSILILGYEPSRVRSRLFLADYSRAAFDLDITPQRFLREYNPMYRRGEELLARYVTQLPQPADGHARILLVNNGSLPYTDGHTNPLGVMHKAEIVNPTESERRVVNSAMLVVGQADEFTPGPEQEFVVTEEISKKSY
jgi:hypothetical protein